MALVTLQRSPTPSAASSSASTSELEVGSDEERKLNLSLSDSFFMVKGAALFLQQGNSPQGPRSLPHPHKHAGDLPQHLQVMINLLRCEDRIKLAVRLESAWADRVRYMVVVYSNGRQDTEENILLGVDFSSKESKSCTIGMVLRLWSDTKIHLDGDGGFSVSTAGKMHIFKPVSVQAMWSALQILHKACEVARRYNYFPGGMALVWATYYESCIASEQSCLNEWNAMQDLESTRPDSPALYVDKPTERERAERLIKAKLRSIMMSKDLENITSKEIRNELEKQMSCNLKEFKEFIDNEMLLILGQMDKPSLIFDHLYLGSEWNASNLEELRGSGVDYILNVTREIDNFFPGMFAYHNIRVYDEETTDLLAHWNEAYRFINKAKRNRSKCLVHCKMGVSRSASTVIAYAMKEFGWSLEKAYNYVKQKRSITRPNAGFMRQLQEYQGILDASKQRHNKLWKQQPEDSLRQSLEGQGGVGNFFLDSFDVDLDPPACPPAFPDPGGSEDPRDFHDRFRSLSDSLPGSRESFFQVEDLEREVLLEEAESAPSAGLLLAELSEGSQAEQPKAEEKADPAALGERKSRKKQLGVPRDGAWPRLDVPEEEDSREEKATERGKRRSSFQEEEEEEEEEESRRNCENVNNNNSSSSSSSKRSCPEEFEHDDALFGILYKVKPPYKSCAECMYPSVGPPAEAFREPQGSPRPAPRCRNSAVCTQPSFLPPGAPAFPPQPFCPPPPRETRGAKTNSWPSALAGSDSPGGGPGKPEPSWATCEASEKAKEAPKAPGGGALLGGRHSLGERGPTLLPEESKEDAWLRKESRPAKDLKCFLFGKEPEKPPTSSYLMQHQESLLQLQKAGLVRKHTKELERLKSFPAEPPAQAKEGPGASIPEETPELAGPSQAPGPPLGPPLSLLRGEAEAEGSPKELPPPLLPPPPPPPPKTSTPVPPAHTSTLAKDFLKTVCYTPSSSSRSSNLTRSSSSDSLHSVREKPGLVRQRAQEIETRLRLAGLTISSPLKRSHSLAKLGSLNLSSEDLSGEAELSVPPAAADSREAQRREPFLGHGGFPSFPKSPGEGAEPSAKPSPGKLKAVPWMEKS